MTNLVAAYRALYPNADNKKEYRLKMNDDGEVVLDYWNTDALGMAPGPEALAAAEAEGLAAMSRYSVSTNTIVHRLEDAGLLTTANSALQADLFNYARFYTSTSIDSDNIVTRTFLTNIGADPDVILAPE